MPNTLTVSGKMPTQNRCSKIKQSLRDLASRNFLKAITMILLWTTLKKEKALKVSAKSQRKQEMRPLK